MTSHPEFGQRAERPTPTPPTDPRPLYGCAALTLALLIGVAAIILAIRW